jgi:hypothetical protein
MIHIEFAVILIILYFFHSLLKSIKMEQSELAVKLQEYKAAIIAKFEALQAQLATADDVTPELQAAADELGAAIGVTEPPVEPTV